MSMHYSLECSTSDLFNSISNSIKSNMGDTDSYHFGEYVPHEVNASDSDTHSDIVNVMYIAGSSADFVW